MRLSIQGMIDDVLSSKGEREKSKKFSPSSFGKCFRAQYWNRKDEPKSNPPDSRVMRVFKAGNLFHDFVQQTIINKYPEIQKEVLVAVDEDIVGYADLVNDIEVIDIKSQHSQAFHYMSKTKDIGEDRKPNWLQVMYYAMALKKPGARLVFVSKDDLCIQEYHFTVDNKWKKEVNDELKILRMWWEKQKLPPAQPRAYGGKECKFCQWMDKCFKLEGKENQNDTRQ